MTEPATLQYHKTLHQLHHEIQNCLSVISVGADVLEKARNDDALLAEFCEAIQEKRRKASHLVDEFLKRLAMGASSRRRNQLKSYDTPVVPPPFGLLVSFEPTNPT